MTDTGSARGIGVSPGIGRGELQVDVDEALDAVEAGRQVVLALHESTPADVVAMTRSVGVMSVTGHGQSHVAIVTKAARVPAVAGLEQMEVSEQGLTIDGEFVAAGSTVTVDGTDGVIRWDPKPPRVVGIQLAKATRLGMVAVDSAVVETAAGLVGDRYHGSKHRQLSVQSLTELRNAEAEFGHPIDPMLTRRNITIDHGAIPRTPGHRWAVGAVELEVVRDAAPCKMLDMEIGDGARTAMRRRAGVICRVISGASIAIGDQVTL